MRKTDRFVCIVVVLAVSLTPAQKTLAQMNTLFDDVFSGILEDQLSVNSVNHENHFIPAAERASANLTPGLNQMIVQNISSFPISSTIAGTIWENTSDGPRKTRTSWGPIFAETGATIGEGGFNLGLTYTSLGLRQLRGVNIEDMTFAFTHKDVNPNDGPLGNLPMESDVVDVVMNMNIDSDVFALTGSYGLRHNLDIGVALPIIQLSIHGNAEAKVNSFTHAALGTANHLFGGTNSQPILTTTQAYSESATGIGDVAVRAKYSFKNTRKEQYGMLLDLRLPTGAEEDFLGSGETNLKLVGIFSRTLDRFTPHLNLAYGYRGAESESNEIAFAVGFDQGINSNLSFAFDILGLLPIDSDKTVSIAPGSTTIVDHPPLAGGTTTRNVKNSNIPEFEQDNTYDAAFGFRYAAFGNAILQANILIPMNDGGLRTGVSTTLGVTMYH